MIRVPLRTRPHGITGEHLLLHRMGRLMFTGGEFHVAAIVRNSRALMLACTYRGHAV